MALTTALTSGRTDTPEAAPDATHDGARDAAIGAPAQGAPAHDAPVHALRGATSGAPAYAPVDAAVDAALDADLDERRRERTLTVRGILAALVVGAAALAAVIFLPPPWAGGVLLGVALMYLTRRLVFTWNGALFILAAVVMFVPIRRYAIPSPFSFQLEPYRLVLLLIIVAVSVALLIDPEFRWRKMRFGVPLAVYLGTLVLSISVNTVSIVEVGLASTAVGGLANLLMMVSVLFLVRQLLTSERVVMTLLQFLAFAGAVVGFFAAVEKVTRTNVFLMFDRVLPLTLLRDDAESFRAGGARAYASAQHPIALAVLLCMLIPIALYLAKHARWPRNVYNRGIIYGLVTLFMFLGIAAAISRTAVVVLGVMFLIVLVFRPYLAIGLGILGAPLLLVATVASPKTVGEMVGSFLDINSLIASQYTSAGWTGAGRLADLDPALEEAAQHPIFGVGFGTRIVVGENANAFILDNHVLGTLLESGAIGVLGLAVFVLTPPITLLVWAFRSKAAKRYTDLAFALALSASAYAAALFFYDALGFMQTLLTLCILLAVGAWLLTEVRADGADAAGSDVDAAAVPVEADATEAVGSRAAVEASAPVEAGPPVGSRT
jgi:hypothetical protein